jgi:hypothetical protein
LVKPSGKNTEPIEEEGGIEPSMLFASSAEADSSPFGLIWIGHPAIICKWRFSSAGKTLWVTAYT